MGVLPTIRGMQRISVWQNEDHDELELKVDSLPVTAMYMYECQADTAKPGIIIIEIFSSMNYRSV